MEDEEKNVITKKLFSLWLTGYLSSSFPDDIEDWDKFMKNAEKVQRQTKEIICFLEKNNCFSKDMKDE